MRSSVCLLAMVALALHANMAHAQTPAAETTSERYLAVTASAEVKAVPDRAMVQLGVETRAETAQIAMARNNEAMGKVVAALKNLGIPDDQLQTSYINLTPIYSHPQSTDPRVPPPAPVLVGFQASNSIVATLQDLGKVGPALDAGVSAGANLIQGISFRLSDEQPFKLDALRQAAGRARAKGNALAAGLEVVIDRVETATEAEFQVIPVERAAPAPVAADGGAATPVLPGELVVRAQVQVKFIIR